MPELPDLLVYREALEQRIVSRRLEKVLILSPFLLRTVDPPMDSALGRRATEVRRIGKRLGVGLEGDLWLVFHLMIAGRLHWFDAGKPLGKRAALARLQWDSGTLTLTEAGTRRRASLHLVSGQGALRQRDPGGMEVLTSTADEFAERLRSENHTLKRALTDPSLCSGIGNAYSDETKSPRFARRWPCTAASACRAPDSLRRQRDQLLRNLPDGRRLLADRALSRLLKKDWPKTVDGFDRDD